MQMWQGRAQSRCGCGRGERRPGADVAGVTADHLGDGPGVLMRVSSRTSLAPAPPPPAPPPASAAGCTARGCGSSMSQSSLSVPDDGVDSDASAVPPKTSSRRASSAAIAWQNLPVIPPTRTYPARHGMPRADHCTPHGVGSRTAWDPAPWSNASGRGGVHARRLCARLRLPSIRHAMATIVRTRMTFIL